MLRLLCLLFYTSNKQQQWNEINQLLLNASNMHETRIEFLCIREWLYKWIWLHLCSCVCVSISKIHINLFSKNIYVCVCLLVYFFFFLSIFVCLFCKQNSKILTHSSSVPRNVHICWKNTKTDCLFVFTFIYESSLICAYVIVEEFLIHEVLIHMNFFVVVIVVVVVKHHRKRKFNRQKLWCLKWLFSRRSFLYSFLFFILFFIIVCN